MIVTAGNLGNFSGLIRARLAKTSALRVKAARHRFQCRSSVHLHKWLPSLQNGLVPLYPMLELLSLARERSLFSLLHNPYNHPGEI